MNANPDLAQWVLAGILPNLAYLGAGFAALAAIGSTARASERFAYAYLVGTGLSSLAILMLRALDLPVGWPLLCLLTAVAAATAWRLRAVPTRSEAAAIAARPSWATGVDAATAVCAGVLFGSALGPEVGWDSLEYHLPILRAWSEGPIRALPGVLDAEFRSGVDLLMLPAVAAGCSDAAASVSACFAATLAALCRAEAGRRFGPGAGAITGLLVLTSPLCLQAGVTADVDLAVGAYGFAALMSADRWNREGRAEPLVSCALMLAFAANAKLHAAILIPATGLLLALGGRIPPAVFWLRGGAAIAALTLPWFAKVALTTGNPLFPLFGEWLGTGATSAEHLAGRRTTLLQDFAVETGPGGFVRWIGFVILGSTPPWSGVLGLLPFALTPFALRRPSRSTAVLCAVAIGLLVLQFAFMRPVRFGTPLWSLLALSAAAGGVRLAGAHVAGRVVVSAAVAAAAVVGVGSLARESLPRIAAIAEPDAFRAQAWPDQIALREMVEAADAVVGISMGAALWMPKPVYNLHWERNGEFFFQGTHPDRIFAVLKQRGVRSLVIAVAAPLPSDGRVGHPTVDAWLRDGRARIRRDIAPRIKRPASAGQAGRLWVLVDLS